MQWDYEQPVRVLFGSGRVHEVASQLGELGYRRAFLVASPFFLGNGLADELAAESGGAVCGSFGDFSENPDVTEVDAAAAAIRAAHADALIAIGGGSAMDLAKAASVAALSGEPIATYHGTGAPVPAEHLPLIAVPTTSGTGSEVTCVSVLTDRARGVKAPIVSPSFYPALAVIDPALTLSVPPHVTASTGIDVLCHALEGYWSRGHQPVCDALALHAARLVFSNLRRAVADGSDLAAREAMSEASVIAGLAFTLPKTTSSHACSFPLTNRYGIPHGEACGLTLDFFCRLNARRAEDGRIDAFARALGFADGLDLADAIGRLKHDIGVRTDLSDLGISEEELASLVAASHHPNMLNNPVGVTDEDLYALYRGLGA